MTHIPNTMEMGPRNTAMVTDKPHNNINIIRKISPSDR